jgi:hypothetical protein
MTDLTAGEFFREVAKRNYEEFTRSRSDFRLLWNAMVSMNTVAEYLALHERGYQPVRRDVIGMKAEEIRNRYPSLREVKFCAETLKHVRKLTGGRNVAFSASSTAVSMTD